MLSKKVVKKAVAEFVDMFDLEPCMRIYLVAFVEAYSANYPHVVSDWTRNNITEFLAQAHSRVEKDLRNLGVLNMRSAKIYLEEGGYQGP